MSSPPTKPAGLVEGVLCPSSPRSYNTINLPYRKYLHKHPHISFCVLWRYSSIPSSPPQQQQQPQQCSSCIACDNPAATHQCTRCSLVLCTLCARLITSELVHGNLQLLIEKVARWKLGWRDGIQGDSGSSHKTKEKQERTKVLKKGSASRCYDSTGSVLFFEGSSGFRKVVGLPAALLPYHQTNPRSSGDGNAVPAFGGDDDREAERLEPFKHPSLSLERKRSSAIATRREKQCSQKAGPHSLGLGAEADLEDPAFQSLLHELGGMGVRDGQLRKNQEFVIHFLDRLREDRRPTSPTGANGNEFCRLSLNKGPVLLPSHGLSREPEPGHEVGHVGKGQLAPSVDAQRRKENRSYSPAAYDLVEHLKLGTVFSGDKVTHRFNPASRCQLQSGDETWARVKFIGQSVLSPTFLERDRKGGQRAVKVVRKSVPLDYSREILTMAQLSEHIYFVRFFGWFEDHQNLFLSMEYIEHGDLGVYINSQAQIDERSAKDIAGQLLGGLNVMVQLGVAHGDLKPQDIFVFCPSPLWLKIGDFGLTKRIEGMVLHTRAYTRSYAAPEVRYSLYENNSGGGNGRRDGENTNAADIWSLGIILHEVLTKKTPFCNEVQLLKYFEGAPSCDLPTEPLQAAGVSTAALAFVKRLLAPGPQDRPTAEEALNDPWLLGVAVGSGGRSVVARSCSR